MLTLSRTDFGLILVAVFVIGIAAATMGRLVLRQIRLRQEQKILESEERMEYERSMIRAEVRMVLRRVLDVDDEGDLDPDDFEEDEVDAADAFDEKRT